jgi:nucleoside-diphosphate-sugar epimerase
MPLELLSSGKQIRAFLYLEDAMAGILKIITSRTESPTNVGSDEAISIREMADKVSHVAGLESPSQSIQFAPSYEQSPNNLSVPSNSALRQLGWTQEVLLEEGILRTLQWCCELPHQGVDSGITRQQN